MIGPRSIPEGDCAWSSIHLENEHCEYKDVFCKRTLRRDEWQFHEGRCLALLRPDFKDRMRNEMAAMQYVRENIDIPVSRVIDHYEHDGCVYLIMETVQGKHMMSLSKEEQEIVIQELEGHIAILHRLKSPVVGGVAGHLCLPYRLVDRYPDCQDINWDFKPLECDLVLCHNDLNSSNFIVDPVTLKITGIIDWENSGFYPAFFGALFYDGIRRGNTGGPGFFFAGDGEADDTEGLMAWFKNNTTNFPEKMRIHDHGLQTGLRAWQKATEVGLREIDRISWPPLDE